MVPEKIQRFAEACALRSQYRFRLGAVIYSGNRIISGGWNDPSKTHPKANTPFKTIHAEFHAAIQVGKTSLRNASIYVVRLGRMGEKRLAKPCTHCSSMLKNLGLEVYYSTEIGVEKYDI